VVRYVERNALRANLVQRAELWRWSSLWRREQGTAEQRRMLSRWPEPCPRDWIKLVNEPQSQAEMHALRRCVTRGQPFGSESWVQQMAGELGLESTLRAPHRPRKKDTSE
jgi:putative transposase